MTKVLHSLIEIMNTNPIAMDIPRELNMTFQLFLMSWTRCWPVSVKRADDTFS